MARSSLLLTILSALLLLAPNLQAQDEPAPEAGDPADPGTTGDSTGDAQPAVEGALCADFASCELACADGTTQNRVDELLIVVCIDAQGLVNGPAVAFYDATHIELQTTFVNDVPHGSWVEFWENGQKMGEGQLFENIEDGAWTTWYETGQIDAQGSYDKGTRTGLWSFYAEDGELQAECTYEGGALTAGDPTVCPPASLEIRDVFK